MELKRFRIVVIRLYCIIFQLAVTCVWGKVTYSRFLFWFNDTIFLIPCNNCLNINLWSDIEKMEINLPIIGEKVVFILKHMFIYPLIIVIKLHCFMVCRCQSKRIFTTKRYSNVPSWRYPTTRTQQSSIVPIHKSILIPLCHNLYSVFR